MRVHLRPCVHCGRHIRIIENRCVFCGAPVDAARQSPPPFGDPAARLRRAATFVAIGTVASAGVGLEACGGDLQRGTMASTQPGASSSSGPLLTAEAYGVNPFVPPGPPNTAPDASLVVTEPAYGVAQFGPLDATANGEDGMAPPDAAGNDHEGPEADAFIPVDADGAPSFPEDGSSQDASSEDGGQSDP